MTPGSIRAARLARHGLTCPVADEAGYLERFRGCSRWRPDRRLCGHWRIKPHDVDDVIVDDDQVAARRRDEVLAAVRRRYPPQASAVLAYNGVTLTGSC